MDQHTPMISRKPSNKTNNFVYVLTFFSAIGGFLFGYDTGVISGAMIILKKKFLLSDTWQELLVAITVGFAAIFSLVGGILNSWIGRRCVIILASFIFFLGSILLGAATTKEMLLVGRAIVGAGIGLASMTVPMYIAEVSPPPVRGRLVTINNLFITGGQFVASCVDGFFSLNEENGWRFMLGLAAVPAFIQLIGFLFLPESPRWLLQKHKHEKAFSSLQKISGSNEEAQKEYEMLQAFVEDNKAKRKNDFCAILKDRGVRRALVIGCGLQMFQQLAGINTVMYYSATIVQMSGIRSDAMAIWLAAAVAFVNFIFTFLGVWLVERMGRRLLTLLSLAGVTFSLLFLSTGFFLSSSHSPSVSYNVSSSTDIYHCQMYRSCSSCILSFECGYCYSPAGTWKVHNATCLPLNSTNNQISLFGPCSTKHSSSGPYFASNYCPTQFSWMAMLGMVLYLAFFAPGMGPMPWTINSEIYPQWARSAGNAASTTTNWLFNVLVSLTFLDTTRLLTTQGAFLLYALLSLLGFFFVLFFLPETKGKPLEEIEHLFQTGCFVCCEQEKNEAYHVILNDRDAQDEGSDEDTLFVR